MKTILPYPYLLPYTYLAPYNTREEGQHRKISVDPENRSVFGTPKSAMTRLFIDFDFFSDLQGRFGWFVNFLLSVDTDFKTELCEKRI